MPRLSCAEWRRQNLLVPIRFSPATSVAPRITAWPRSHCLVDNLSRACHPPWEDNAPTRRTNLQLLREDPTQTIRAYSEIVKVVLDGRALAPAYLFRPSKLPNCVPFFATDHCQTSALHSDPLAPRFGGKGIFMHWRMRPRGWTRAASELLCGGNTQPSPTGWR
jgi:hypothetical protein